MCRASAQIDALGKRTTFLYDSQGRQETVIDALGNRGTTVFDSQGRVSAQVDTLGKRTTTIFDAYGRMSATVDPSDNRITTTYDLANRAIASIDALGNHATTQYDVLGRAEASIDYLNRRTTHVFDALNRETVSINYQGGRTTMAYDGLNRLTSTKNPFNNITTQAYDTYGRQSASTSNLGTASTVYDTFGRQVATIDELGNRTTTVLDDMDRQVNLIDASGNKTTFVYDAVGQKTQQIDPNGNSVTYAYDPAGRLSSTTDRDGRRRDFGYDAVGRKTTETWYDATPAVTGRITFTYDAEGRTLTAANDQGAYTLTYDAKGQVATVKDILGNTLTFTYDGRGLRTMVQDSLGGITTSTYYGDGQLSSRRFGGSGQTISRFDFGYTLGQPTTIARYSDMTATTLVARTTLGYDVYQQLTSLVTKDAPLNLIANLGFTYDANQRLSAASTDGALATYSYDNTSQLTGDGANTVTYDASGNRTTLTTAGGSAGYTTGTGNKLTTDGTWNYTYSNEGNMTKKVKISNGLTWTYAYTNWNQLTHVERRTTDGGTLEMSADYKYDAFGNRTEKSVDADGAGAGGTVTTRFAYDNWNPAKAGSLGTSGNDVWGEFSGGSLTTRYILGDKIDERFVRQDGGTPYWSLTDHLGSVRKIVDNSGVVKDAITYDGFGNITTETASAFRGRYAWTGREIDTETALQYNRARYYDSTTGRWITQDPLGFDAGDSNLYRYVNNRPTIAIDPSGMVPYELPAIFDGYWWQLEPQREIETSFRQKISQPLWWRDAALRAGVWQRLSKTMPQEGVNFPQFYHENPYAALVTNIAFGGSDIFSLHTERRIHGLQDRRVVWQYDVKDRFSIYPRDIENLMKWDKQHKYTDNAWLMMESGLAEQFLGLSLAVAGARMPSPAGAGRNRVLSPAENLQALRITQSQVRPSGIIPGTGSEPVIRPGPNSPVPGPLGIRTAPPRASGPPITPGTGSEPVIRPGPNSPVPGPPGMRNAAQVQGRNVAIEGQPGFIGPLRPPVALSNAPPRTGGYRNLTRELEGTGQQAHHLNQNAAYRDIIPESEGLSVGLRGNAFTEVGSPHYHAHRSLEGFWNQFRRGGARFGQTPTNAEYGQALEQSLRAAGLSNADAATVAAQAAQQRAAYPLLAPNLPVPRIPGRINQTPPPTP